MKGRVTETARVCARASWIVARTVLPALPIAMVFTLLRPDRFPLPRAVVIGLGAPLGTFILFFAFFFLVSVTSPPEEVQFPRLRNILWPVVVAIILLFVGLVWLG